MELGYPVIQPASLKGDEIHRDLLALRPDVFVVVAFGHILSKQLLQLPRLGAVNVHASLLPKYRGPAPIHRAIIAGEKETGITTMRMDVGLDTGDVFLTQKTGILSDDTTESLRIRLAELGASLLIKTLEGLEAGTLTSIPQNHDDATYAPMLTKAEGLIDWALPAVVLERTVRGMTPWPGTFTFFQQKRIKIFSARALREPTTEPPGRVVRGFADELRVATGDGTLSILELQSESGKRLPVKTFLRGMRIEPGAMFG